VIETKRKGKQKRRWEARREKCFVLFCMYVCMDICVERCISVDGCMGLDNVQGGSPFIKYIIFKNRYG
jgi:hypothetical protein